MRGDHPVTLAWDPTVNQGGAKPPLMLWQLQERVMEVGGGHHSRIVVLNPNDHQTQRQRLWEGEVGRVQWAGRGGRAPGSLPRSEVLVWLWAPFPQAPGFRHTGSQEGWIWAQFRRVPRKGGGLIPCSPGCFPTTSEVSLSHPACGGRRLTLFSVLAGEGRMPKAGGPQGAPAAPGAGLPAALSSTTPATGSQTAAA